MWNPSLSFLKSGHTTATLSYRKSALVSVEWSFQTSHMFPCQLVQCTLNAGGKSVLGFGYDLFSKNAMRIALAEAWERFVFQTYRECTSSPEQVRFTSTGYAAGPSEEDAIRNAENEFRERYLLYLAGLNINELESYAFKDPLCLFLISSLEKKWKSKLQTHKYHDPFWGNVLLAWMHTSKGSIYDSYYLENISATKLRHILMSLLVTQTPKVLDSINPLPLKALRRVHDCTELQSRLLYSGENLPPVAVAFDSFTTNQNSYFNQWTQDQLFASFFCKIYKPTEAKLCS